MNLYRLPIILALCISLLPSSGLGYSISAGAQVRQPLFDEEALIAPALHHMHRITLESPYLPLLLAQDSFSGVSQAILLIPLNTHQVVNDKPIPLPVHRAEILTRYLQEADESTMREHGIPKPYRSFIHLLRDTPGKKDSLRWWHQHFEAAFLYSGDQAIVLINRLLRRRQTFASFLAKLKDDLPPTPVLQQHMSETKPAGASPRLRQHLIKARKHRWMKKAGAENDLFFERLRMPLSATSENKVELTRYLLKAAVRLRIRQVDICRVLGISKTSLDKYSQGTRTPKLVSVKKLLIIVKRHFAAGNPKPERLIRAA